MLLAQLYKNELAKVEKKKEDYLSLITGTFKGREEYHLKQNNCKNDRLEEFVTDKNNLDVIIEHNGELIQKTNLVYLDPISEGILGAHFYAPRKKVFGVFMDTLLVNVMIIWSMTFILFIALYLNIFRKFIGLWEKYLAKKKSIETI